MRLAILTQIAETIERILASQYIRQVQSYYEFQIQVIIIVDIAVEGTKVIKVIRVSDALEPYRLIGQHLAESNLISHQLPTFAQARMVENVVYCHFHLSNAWTKECNIRHRS